MSGANGADLAVQEMTHPGHKQHQSTLGPWTSLPILKLMVTIKDAGQLREIAFLPKNFEPEGFEAYSNDTKEFLAHRALSYDDIVAKADGGFQSGFTWIAAKQTRPDRVTVANTVYFGTDRGGKNPTAMFLQVKNRLEIIPIKYPREHSHYRANEEWPFLIRFDGYPLADQALHVVTQNGTHLEFHSDASGHALIRFPDDFDHASTPSEPKQHRHMGISRMSEFVIETEHSDHSVTFVTGFNGSYTPTALYGRSLAIGIGFMSLGMIGALPLVRYRKKIPLNQASGDHHA
jgi:hypothetical protein